MPNTLLCLSYHDVALVNALGGGGLMLRNILFT